MSPPEDHPARYAPPVWYAPYGGPGHDVAAAWCLSVLHSVMPRSFAADFALEHVRANGGPQAADVDCALGQLDGIVRQTREYAFQLHNADTRIWRVGSADDGRKRNRMPPGEYQALTEFVRETLARARVTARRSAEVRATAAELTVIAEDLCSRARAECEPAQELAGERLRRCHTDAVVVHLGTGQPSQALNCLSPSRARTRAAIRQASDNSPSAAAVPTPAIRGLRPVCRRV